VVVPLRYGAGIKGKVVESMAKGVPLVTTSIGAEGFYDAENYLAVKDDAEAFARRVLALYDDKEALCEMTTAAYGYLETYYSKAKAEEVIKIALER
jgi:glycosyltransferase involved in cell wall biosynthesis